MIVMAVVVDTQAIIVTAVLRAKVLLLVEMIVLLMVTSILKLKMIVILW